MVSGKWVAIALTVSLAVNVFLAGMFVGRHMSGPPMFFRATMQRPAWRPGDSGLPPMVERIASGMSPEYRDILLSTMKRHQSDITAAGTALRDARGKLRQIIGAETLDRAAAEAAAADMRQRSDKFQTALQSAFLDAAQSLPAEGRRQMISPERRGPPRP